MTDLTTVLIEKKKKNTEGILLKKKNWFEVQQKHSRERKKLIKEKGVNWIGLMQISRS